MSEAEAKVRLVRCPKCENLLPELTDYSVYRCGGCDAILRAKSENLEADTFSEKSDEEKVGRVLEKSSDELENLGYPEKGMLNNGNYSENVIKSSGSSFSKADKRGILHVAADKHRNGLATRPDKWVADDQWENDKEVSELGYEHLVQQYEILEPHDWHANGSRRSGQISGRTGGESFPRIDRHSASRYAGEGPSNQQAQSDYVYAETVKNRDGLSGVDKVEYGEPDREELLRKLDELKDQLSRSFDLVDKPKEKVPVDKRMLHQDPYHGSENCYPDGSLGLNRAPIQYSVPEKHVTRPPYNTHHDGPSTFTNRQEMALHKFYPSLHAPSQVHQGYGDSFRSQMISRAPNQAPAPGGSFPEQPYPPHFSGHYVDNDMVCTDPFAPYPPNIRFHQLSCSCIHCYNKRQHVTWPVPPAAYSDRTFSDGPNSRMLYLQENPGAFAPLDYNPRIANPPPLSSQIPQSHSRWPTDLNSENGSFVHRRPQRVLVAIGGRHCQPIVDGAPFIACQYCFELLQLPKRFILLGTKQNKIRCGACSAVIHFTVSNKRLVFIDKEARKPLAKINNASNVAGDEHNLHPHNRINQASNNFSSEDYDNSGYDFLSMDREHDSSPAGQGLGSSKSLEMQSLHSTSSCMSGEEGNLNNLITRRKKPYSAELPRKSNASPPPAGSPLQDHFDYSSKFHPVDMFGKGNINGLSEQEKTMQGKAISRQNSQKEASLATEIDISSNEYSNTTATSQDSGEGSRGEDQLRGNKAAKSFLAGIIKKSFRDFAGSNQMDEQEKANVVVNGHFMPDRLVKKARKLAGPIQPGQYWYDFRVGFWGVMGGPCLGIIPPFIEEFNHPMPENCAGGNTHVFVNGRELHQKDLNLLGSRGLPTEQDRRYIIEISGRVLDEESGEELDGLGKLAPTVERAKRGFGMKVPRAATT